MVVLASHATRDLWIDPHRETALLAIPRSHKISVCLSLKDTGDVLLKCQLTLGQDGQDAHTGQAADELLH